MITEWGAELGQKLDPLKNPTVRSVLRSLSAEDLLLGLSVGSCREKWSKKTGTVHLGGKQSAITMNSLLWKVMKFFLGRLWKVLIAQCIVCHLWGILSMQPAFLAGRPGISLPLCLWFEMFLLSTLGCYGQEKWDNLCPWCDLKDRKWRKVLLSKSFRNHNLWNNRKPQRRLETRNQGCPEQQWKTSIDHMVCLLYYLSFSQGFFQPPPHFMIPVLLSWMMVEVGDSTFGHIYPHVACPSHPTHALVVMMHIYGSQWEIFSQTLMVRCVSCGQRCCCVSHHYLICLSDKIALKPKCCFLFVAGNML